MKISQAFPILWFLALPLLALSVVSLLLAEPDPRPSSFFGQVRVDGAAAGNRVSAEIGEVELAVATTTVEGPHSLRGAAGRWELIFRTSVCRNDASWQPVRRRIFGYK